MTHSRSLPPVFILLRTYVATIERFVRSELYQIFQKAAISKHIKNIYACGELVEPLTVSKMETVQKEGNRTISRMRRIDKLESRMDKAELNIKQIQGGVNYLVKQLAAPPKPPRRNKIGFHP